ncbi:Wnt inhibitory factor, partial [Acrasis kona]
MYTIAALLLVFLITGGVNSQCFPALPTPLVSYLLNETSGNTITDYRNGQNATIVGNPAVWSPLAPPGYVASILLNGDGSLFRLPLNGFNPQQSYSIVSWIRITNTNAQSTILYIHDAVFFFQYHTTEKNFQLCTTKSNYYRARSQFGPPVVNTWYQITGVFDRSTSSIAFYVNGALQQNVTATASDVPAYNYFIFGAIEAAPGTPNDRTQGNLGPVLVYQTAFTSTQARDAYSLSLLPCSNNGVCMGNGTCNCYPGYFGPTCSYYNCSGTLMIDPNVCSARGLCNASNSCNCNPGYSGANCENYYCNNIHYSNQYTCSGAGTCTAPNTCVCNAGIDGKYCERPKCLTSPLPTPVVRYLLSEGSGNTIYDRTNGFNSTIIGNNAVWSNSSPPGYYGSLVFNGDGSFFRISQNGFDIRQSFTIVTWLKITDLNAQSTVLYLEDYALFFQYHAGAKNLQFVLNKATNRAVSQYVTPAAQQWYQMTAVFDKGNSTAYLYVNGVLQHNLTAVSNDTSKFSYFTFGAAQNAAGTIFDKYVGLLGPLTVYQSAFTAAQASSAYSLSMNSCSNNGVCNGDGTCTCNTGYSGTTCSYFTCNNITMSNSSVCSGAGYCISSNNCNCNSGYSGSNCEIFYCFGVLSSNSSVCSGSGTCVSSNVCSCYGMSTGTNCESYKCNAATPSPLARYSLDEGAGNVIMDSLNKNNSTMLNGNIVWSLLAPPGYTRSIALNGSGSYFRLPFNGFNPQKSYTIITWVRITNLNAQSTILYINDAIFYLQYHAGEKNFQLCTTKTYYYRARSQFGPPLANIWYQITGTFDGVANTTSLYVNGVLQQTINATAAEVPLSNYFTFGAMEATAGDVFDRTVGNLGSIQVHQTAFTPYQAKMAYSFSLNTCSGNGVCGGDGKCNCSAGYSGSTCSFYSCYGVLMTNTSVCNGRGICNASNSCLCSGDSFGSNCEFFYCNKVLSTNQSVCSGQGICSAPNTCVCNSAWTGSNCEIARCLPNLPIPVTRYLLNEGSGNTIYDVINGQNSTLIGNPVTWSALSPPGYSGSVLLSGNSAYFRLPIGAFNPQQSFTIVTWFRMNDVTNYNTVLYLHDEIFYFQYNSFQGNLQLCFTKNYYRAKSNIGSPVAYNWYQMTGVYDGSVGALMFYVNGVLQQNVSAPVPPSSGPAVNYLTYGAVEKGTSIDDKVVGNLGPISVYQTAFTSSQVQDAFSLSILPCSGNGQCQSNGQCSCNNGYTGTSCSYYNCFGVAMTSNSVCSGRGICNSSDSCSCSPKYFGPNCEKFNCYGTLYNSSSVCSGNGACSNVDNCVCRAGYYGQQCEAWNCYGVVFNSTS